MHTLLNKLSIIYITYPLYIVLCISIQTFAEFKVEVFLFDLSFSFIVFTLCWGFHKLNFERLYSLNDFLYKFNGKEQFAGLELSYSKVDRKNEQLSTLSGTPIYKLLLTFGISFIYWNFYPGTFGQQIFMASFLSMFLIIVNFWGSLLLFIYFITFCYLMSIPTITEIDYLHLFIVSFLLFFNLAYLNSWFWKKLLERELTGVKDIFTKSIKPLVLFLTVFTLSNLILPEARDKESSVEKISKQVASKKSLQMFEKLKQDQRLKNFNFNPPTGLSEKGRVLSKEYQDAKKQRKQLEKIKNPTNRDLNKYLAAIEKEKELTHQLTENLDTHINDSLRGITNLTPKERKNLLENMSKFQDGYKDIPSSNFVGYQSLKQKLQAKELLKNIRDTKAIAEAFKEYQRNSIRDGNVDPSEFKKLKNLAQEISQQKRRFSPSETKELKEKQEQFLQMLEQSEKVETKTLEQIQEENAQLNENLIQEAEHPIADITSRRDSIDNAISQLESSQRDPEEQRNTNEIKRLAKELNALTQNKSKISKNQLKEIARKQKEIIKKLKDSNHVNEKTLKDIQNKNLRTFKDLNSQQLVHNLKENIADELDQNKKEQNKANRIKNIVTLALVVLAIFYILELLKKAKIKKERAFLNKEQVEELNNLFNNSPKNKYKDFLEEVDFKYKFFHSAIQVIFYPQHNAPPALVIPKNDQIKVNKPLRISSRVLGDFFNLVHFAKKNKYSDKEKKIFRDNFKKFEKALKKLI